VLGVDATPDTASPSGGKVLATTRPFPRFHYGDRLTLTGKVTEPLSQGGFDYRDYLARQGVASLASFPRIKRTGGGGGSALERTLWRIRRPLAAAVERALPEPDAALGEGMLLGLRSSIPRDLNDDFNTAGISHIIAISGYNVTLVAGMAFAFFAWPLGRRRATAAAMLAVVLFVLLVGPTPSVLRAGVMGLVMLGATFAGRPGSAATAIAVSAALLTARSPLAIDDVSFQLSFAATVGLVFLAEPIHLFLAGLLSRALPSGFAGVVAENTSVTLAATLASAPIIGATFGRISVVALPANLVAAPLVPIIIATTALTAIGGVLSNSLGAILGDIAQPPLGALIAIARIGANAPGAAIGAGFGTVLAAALYIGGAALGYLVLRRPPKLLESPPPRHLGFVTTAALLAVVAAISWWHFLFGGDDHLHLTFLDTGRSEVILVRTAAGHHILIDGGPSGTVLEQILGRELGKAATFDLVVLTQPRDDHVTGLAGLVSRHGVKAALIPATPGETASYRSFRAALDAKGIRTETAVAGKWIDLGKGTRIEIVAPAVGDQNVPGNRVALRLVDGSISFLLASGLTTPDEQLFLNAPASIQSTVLQPPANRTGVATSARFIAAVAPAVMMVGEGQGSGRSSTDVLAGSNSVPSFSRQRNGTIRFETDGRRLWATPDRGTVVTGSVPEATTGR
jgi:competence protein ComEC